MGAKKDYEFHPVADIFPLMEGAAYAELVADIREHGLRDSILIAEDKIADGRNRYMACKDAEVEPRFEKWNRKGSLVALVLSRNAHRRHMDRSQLAIVAAKALPFFEGEAATRSSSGGVAPDGARVGKAAELAAETLGASTRNVERAKLVLEKGSAELVEAVESGEVSVSDAAKIVDLPKAEQSKAVKAVRAGKAKTVAAAVKPAKGEPAVDVRRFDAVKTNLGKIVRDMTDLKQHAGGAEFHETIRKSLNVVFETLEAWKKHALKA